MRDYLDDSAIKLRKDRTAASAPASRRPFVLALILCLVAFGLIALDYVGAFQPVRGAAQQALVPAAQWLTGFRDGMGGFWSAPRTETELRERVRVLEEENSQLHAELLKREQAQIDNIELRKQLSIEQAYPWRLLSAQVAVRSPDAGRRVMTISKGSTDGVAPGMAVIGLVGSSPASLVGVVETVGPYTAEVLLITDFGSQISAQVLHSDTTALGLVQGQWQRGSRLRLENLERDAQVDVGDPVVTAGLSKALGLPLTLGAVPANVPIGTVETLSTDGLARVAELRPYVDPDFVEDIWVLISQND